MIEISKTIQVKAKEIEAGDYIINLGEVLKVEITLQFSAFTIRGLCLSASFYWYPLHQEIFILKKNK